MPETPIRLDRICSILAPTSTRDADGGPVETYAAVKTAWCRREDRGGNEQRTSGALRFESDATFTIRHVAFPGLTTKHRILCEGRTYSIDAINEGGRRQWWRVFASQRQGQA